MLEKRSQHTLIKKTYEKHSNYSYYPQAHLSYPLTYTKNILWQINKIKYTTSQTVKNFIYISKRINNITTSHASIWSILCNGWQNPT